MTDERAAAAFATGKRWWRARTDVPFVTYTLRERYVWHGQPQEHRWSGTLHTSGGAIVLQRLDATTGAFTVLDPPLSPIEAFGMAAARTHAVAPRAVPVRPGGLREIARFEAIARDYALESVGDELLAGEPALHILLSPLHDPGRYRLRDLWLSPDDGRTLQVATDGLFENAPYNAARWIAHYTTIAGRTYLDRVYNVDTLGFDGELVRDLRFEFTEYAFPTSLSYASR